MSPVLQPQLVAEQSDRFAMVIALGAGLHPSVGLWPDGSMDQ